MLLKLTVYMQVIKRSSLFPASDIVRMKNDFNLIFQDFALQF